MNTNLANYTRPPSALETERLLLRAPRLEDALELSELAAADPSFARSTVGDAENNSIESACTAIVRMLEDRRLGRGFWWVVTEKPSGRTVGIVGYSDRSPGSNLVSALAADCIGRGYLSETVAAIANLGAIGSPRPLFEETDMAMESEHEIRDRDVRWYWRSKAGRSRSARERRCA